MRNLTVVFAEEEFNRTFDLIQSELTYISSDSPDEEEKAKAIALDSPLEALRNGQPTI